MATKQDTSTSDIREEFNVLKNEVGEFMKTLKAYEKERIHDARNSLNESMNEYSEIAREKLRKAQASGEKTVKDVEGKIRDNPLSSLAIAFAVGFLASKISRKDH